MLEGSVLFKGLPESDRLAIEDRCVRLKLRNGTYLYHEDQPGDALYVVLSGRVSIWSGGERGEPTLLTVLGQGEMFGEMAVLSNEHLRTASAQAMSRLEVIQILRADIDLLRRKHPRVNDVFLTVLIQRIQRLTMQVAELVELDGSTRLFRQLSRLGDVFGKRPGAHIPISQQQLASMIGLGLRLTNRALNDAQRDGALTLGRGWIAVDDWNMVRRLAGWRYRTD